MKKIWVIEVNDKKHDSILYFHHYTSFKAAMTAFMNHDSDLWCNIEDEIGIFETNKMNIPIKMGFISTDKNGNGDDYYFIYENGITIYILTPSYN